MKQIFCSQTLHPAMRLELDEKTAHHLFDVLRTSSSEVIRIVDADGAVFLGHTLRKPFVQVETPASLSPAEPDLTLCAALIKGDRFEWLLQKAAELGATRIVPFTCRRTVVTIEPRKLARRMERWASILENACRQSNRRRLVELTAPCRLEELAAWQSALNLMAWEKASGSHHLGCELGALTSSATFVIGPEGGFTEEEAGQLEKMGYIPVSLGRHILRAETAACYVLSAADTFWTLNTQGCPAGKNEETVTALRAEVESGE